MRENRFIGQDRCYHLISRLARRAFEGVQAANRKGRAAMTRDDYCGNLLWQSGLTLFAPDGEMSVGGVVPELDDNKEVKGWHIPIR